MTITTPDITTDTQVEPKVGPKIEIVDVAPEQARVWLEMNTHNRPIGDARVAQFARDMERGDWQLTGEAVKFDVNGVLLDGQHRLWACVESDVTFRTVVITDLPPESQEVMDTGQKRTAGQVLGLRGYSNPNHVAAVASMIHQWNSGNRFRDITAMSIRNITHAEINKVVDENSAEIVDAVAFAQARPITGTSLTPRAFALYLLRKIDRDAADAYFADLSTMRTEGYGDPRSALLRRLARAREERESIDRHTQALMFIRVWNAIRKGEQLFRVNTRVRGGALDVEEPV